ncbi:8-amino-7-oxononanoate synthase [Anaeroselena agilis]|uniref:8-amino-7-ketopelargonate synthase n=1 Tax=Anaeroselena agilis TaxID=3063788 RepID=A0ABU3P691_9FIRM|nr:8-amino-7-oxononanoate synthase [Selenomonadales bacterium 4137-cl]
MDALLRTRLDMLKEAGLHRRLTACGEADEARDEGSSPLMLASNDYLGLTRHPAVRRAAADAAMRLGGGAGGSRLTTGNHALYAALEEELAAFKGTEAALVFGSGYMANIGTLGALAGGDDVIFSDELNHASIVDGCRLAKARTVVYRHCDPADLAAKLAATPCRGQRFIVTDGVFSMDGDVAPVDEIVAVAGCYGAAVMVDDAHGTGVVGPGGRGTAALFGVGGRVAVQMGTLSKALASEGGYIAGSAVLIEYLVNRARSFIFTTALAPATVAAARAALALLVGEPELTARLRDNAVFLRRALTAAGLAVGTGETPIIPVTVGEAAVAVALAADLRRAGIVVSAIRPPTVPDGSSRLRVTVSAAHTRGELARAAAEVAAAAGRLGLRKEGR